MADKNNLYGDSDDEHEENVFAPTDDDDISEASSVEEDEEESEEKYVFKIIEDIDDEDEEVNEVQKEQKPKKKKKKKRNPDEIGKPKYFKLDISKLKEKAESRGVIYISSPPKGYDNERKLREYFEQFGNISRIQAAVQVRRKKKHTIGFYVEFENKDTAKRVALSLNLQPISKRDSRMWSIRYMPDFNWGKIVEEEERKEMYKKLIKAQAEKELRELEMYKARAQKSKKMKKQNIKPKRSFRISQKEMSNEKDSVDHVEMLPVFKKRKIE